MLLWTLFASVAYGANPSAMPMAAPATPWEEQSEPEPESATGSEDSWSCGMSSVSGRIVRDKTGEQILIAPTSEVRVLHKVDIDAEEDRCITGITIEHQPERGCKYRLIFGVVPGESDLLLSEIMVAADSFCPGWPDWHETGDPTKHPFSAQFSPSNADDNIRLTLSTRNVPDRTADTSCTDLSINTRGSIEMNRSFGSKPETFSLQNVSFWGQYNSKGDPNRVCPAPKQITVAAPIAPAPAPAPAELGRAFIALLAHGGTAAVPTFSGMEIGLTALLEATPQVTLSVATGSMFGPSILYVEPHYVFGDPTSVKPRVFGGFRLGRLKWQEELRLSEESLTIGDTYIEDYSRLVIGPVLGLETSRARTVPFYASIDLAAFLYNQNTPVYTSMVQDLEATQGGIMATVRVGAFLGSREND